MWPFKKKEPECDINNTEFARLKSFRDVGETFNYLGRECIVTGFGQYPSNVGYIPLLRFDYCDNNGVLHSVSARIEELPALMNQQIDTYPKQRFDK